MPFFFRFERGDQKYEHMLDGDGYVCAFSFSDDGRMHFRSSYVKTKYVPGPQAQHCFNYGYCVFAALELLCCSYMRIGPGAA